ncbi:DegT/DnrJ/EryC1/StrS family aminotransferase [Streptomyces sp. NBC_01538]|uniref:DegT/DnrJ/EryC1/StrS family aminotransferase n=1 Tax=Streptomyces sp. NBC_01538 TaxID=2903897 RepID=UPI0038658D1A
MLLSERYGRPEVTLTASGAAAVEATFRWLGLGPGDEVIVPDTGCYKIAAAAVREGATPIFADVGRSLVLGPQVVSAAFTTRTRCVVCVHQYGLVAPVEAVRRVLPPEVAVIEDAAQAWDAWVDGRRIGRDGDATVISFGASKPVPVGAGGAVLGDDARMREWIGSDAPEHRLLATPPTPAPFPKPLLPALAERLVAADQAVAEQRQFVQALAPLFGVPGFVAVPTAPGDRPSWHRVPVWCANVRLQQRLLRSADAVGIHAQAEHEVALPSLPMFAGLSRHVRIGEPALDGRLVVLKPRDGPRRVDALLSTVSAPPAGG